MTPQRPTTFRDWKHLWHEALKEVGFSVAHAFDGRRVIVGRGLYRQLHRLKRIRQRLDVESEVRDQMWFEELFALMGHKRRLDGQHRRE